MQIVESKHVISEPKIVKMANFGTSFARFLTNVNECQRMSTNVTETATKKSRNVEPTALLRRSRLKMKKCPKCHW